MRLLSCRWFLVVLALAACHSPQQQAGMKIGKPYVVDGKTYYPEYDPTYDKIGMASWYGPGFHGKYTASGEVFNQNDLTAAHPTLPMPSLVRVTNLATGKSLIVRINDRGPFKSNRIIDLSKASAHELGIRSTSQVRVQYLKAETVDYMASLQKTGEKTSMTAYNDKAEKAKDDSIMRSTEPQIVEANDASTHAGQIVAAAAPVMTVDAGALPRPAAQTNLRDTSGRKIKTFPLMHEAMADEQVVSPPKIISAPAAPVELASKESEPAAMPVVQKLPDSTPPPKSLHDPRGGYYIQAGSFAAEENAHKQGSILENIGRISIDKVSMSAKIWWRVRVGPFTDKPAADEALNRVRAAGLPDARLLSL